MPFYIRTLDNSADYGGVVNVYSYIAVFLVILTFGFETGFFRFVKTKSRDTLLKTLGTAVTCASAVLILLVYIFRLPIAEFLGSDLLTDEHFILAAIIVGLDAITSIPFAALRIENRSKRFAGLKFLSVLLNIGFNVFFLVLCPLLIRNGYTFIENIFDANNKLIYVFYSNLISSAIIGLILIPSIFRSKAKFDWEILKTVSNYSYPIMIVGLFGMVIQNIDKILMPHLITTDSMKALAIYGANYKIGILMALFIQSYRLAFEPFFFKEGKENASKELYARILKYFVLFGVIIYVGVLLFMDLINVLLTPDYYEGNIIIPFILLGQLFFGIYYSLSLWYKLTDKTNYGAVISAIGAITVVIANIILVPEIGYLGAAISSMLCFLLMMILSYILGQKFYPVPYKVGRIIIHILLAILVVYFTNMITLESGLFFILIKGTIFAGYIGLIGLIERKDFIKILR